MLLFYSVIIFGITPMYRETTTQKSTNWTIFRITPMGITPMYRETTVICLNIIILKFGITPIYRETTLLCSTSEGKI